MACPTCDHTMQSFDTSDARKFYWCPRCGTAKFVTGHVETKTPSLVQRVYTVRNYAVASALIDEIELERAIRDAEEACVLPDNRKMTDVT